jgi:MSHA biogenesis protein MshM
MYYSHFGLTQPPFRITPNTEFFYGGGNRGPILEALIYAISQGEGITKVTGEVGSGKTMLCNMLQSRLPANVETVYIANPSVSPDEILFAIAFELHLNPPRDAGHLEIMQLLHRHLLDRHAQQKQVVMFIEESQSMPIATLEEIRLLSNLETAHSKLLQIVLFGQPELEENLRQPNIRQLRERITHSFRLSPLKHDEIHDYLEFRVRAAGYRGPDLFSREVIKAIEKASDGLTRRINLIADKALLAAFSENTHTIDLKHIKAAVRDSEFSSYEPPRSRLKLGLALSLLAIGAGLGIALYAIFQAQRPSPLTARDPVSSPAPQQPARSDTGAVPPAGPVEVPGTAPDAPTTLNSRIPTSSIASHNSPAAGAASSAPAAAAAPIAAPKQSGNEQQTQKKQEDTKAVSENSQSPRSDADPVQLRIAATQNWLTRQAPDTHTIQLLGADNAQQLKNHLNIISKYLEINDIYVYRTIAKQKPSLTVIYGTFNDRQTAKDALATLPAPLRAYKPLLRTVRGIRTEIASHPSS